MDLKNFFCLRFNLSNESITSALRPGLKTGTDFNGLLKTGAENYIVWSGSGFGEPGGTPPLRIAQEYFPTSPSPPPPPPSSILNRLTV